MEDIPEGEKSQYDGYALRFAPLSENAVKESWSGRMKGGVSTKSTKFTLLGYIQAGCPKELQLFKPGDDPDNDEPELTLDFKLSAPVTEVTIGGGLSIDEIVGTYDIVLSNDDGDTEEIQNVYTKNENGQLVRNGAAMDYDPITGTSTYTIKFDDGDYITQMLVFSSENGRISISGTILAVGKGRSMTYIKGTKID